VLRTHTTLKIGVLSSQPEQLRKEFLSILHEGYNYVMQYLATVIVLVLPGAALLLWTARRGPDVFCRLADAVGLSISLTAMVGLLFFVMGLSPGWLGGLVLYAAALLICIAALLRSGPALAGGWISSNLPPGKEAGKDTDLTRGKRIRTIASLVGGAVLLVAAVAWRWYQARGLVFPAWVDSIHHTLIVRQIIETGGVPQTMQPYLNAPFYYYYGFHIATAAFAQWSSLQPDQAVLWLGQLLNALVGLGIYRFARSMDLRVRAALPAALLTGFVMQMPAYYVTWGRFTLVAGWVVLLPAMAAALDARRDPHKRGAWIQLAVLSAGLCLTHYLTVVLFLLFIGLLALEVLVTRRRSSGPQLLSLALPSLVGGLAALPWLVRVIVYQPSSLQVGLSGEISTDWNYLNYLLGPRYNHILMILAAAGFFLCAVLLLIKHFTRSEAPDSLENAGGQSVFALWTVCVLFLSLPFGLRLGPFRPDHFVIVLFFPAVVWLGITLSNGSGAITRRWGRWTGHGALLLAVALLVVWGLRESRNVLNPVTLLADQQDRLALDWINQNLPASARFYINAAYWQDGTYRGVDGGAWLLPYTGRGALVPPISYMWLPAEEYTQINRWAKQTQSLDGCTPDFWQMVREAGLTHIYLRQGRGSLQPEMLTACPRIKELYQAGGVWIYEILLP
jgi:hypothetical protein